MGAALRHIWRHPIKSHGREAVDRVTLTKGATLPWDRVWAVAHEASKFDRTRPEWMPCPNFVLASKAPELQAVSARVDEAAGTVTLTHPDRPALVVNPDLPADAEALVAWSRSLVPASRAAPAFVARTTRGMTDTDFPSVSINSLSSLQDLSQRAGRELEPGRFRGNLWVEGWEPWAELELIGREITIGGARLLVREPIRRCVATATSTQTGVIDFPTPDFIETTWGHRDFGIYAEVIGGGEVRVGDPVVVVGT